MGTINLMYGKLDFVATIEAQPATTPSSATASCIKRHSKEQNPQAFEESCPFWRMENVDPVPPH